MTGPHTTPQASQQGAQTNHATGLNAGGADELELTDGDDSSFGILAVSIP